jgi:hypothetical protein
VINDITHKDPERERIARELAEFKERGGEILILRSYGDLMHEPLPPATYNNRGIRYGSNEK